MVGKPLRLAVTGWLISLGLGLLIALAFAGFTMTTLVAGLCLATTALGTILPIVRDAGLVKSEFGARVPAIGAPAPLASIRVLLRRPRSACQAALRILRGRAVHTG